MECHNDCDEWSSGSLETWQLVKIHLFSRGGLVIWWLQTLSLSFIITTLCLDVSVLTHSQNLQTFYGSAGQVFHCPYIASNCWKGCDWSGLLWNKITFCLCYFQVLCIKYQIQISCFFLFFFPNLGSDGLQDLLPKLGSVQGLPAVALGELLTLPQNFGWVCLSYRVK